MKQTTKSLVTLLALVVVALGIAGIAYWANKDEEKKTEAKEKNEKLFDFDKAKVKALRLEKDSALVASAEKSGTDWKLKQPLQVEGDDVAINAVVDQLSSLKQKKELGDDKDVKPYGLDKPHLRVAVTLDDGKEQALEIGGDNSFDNSLYVRRAGDPTVRLVDGYVKSSFDKSLFDLRDKRVAHLDDNATVNRIEVSGVKKPYVLVKDGTAWKLEKPAGAADGSTADHIVSSLKSLRATAVAAESATLPAQYGLLVPRATAKLTVSTGKDSYTRTIVFGQVSGKTWAKRDDSGVVYEVNEQILKDLDKDLFELQDKQLVHVDREQIRKVTLESPAGKVEIERRKDTPPDGGIAEETFEVTAPQKAPGKKWKLSSALYSITGLRAASFEQPKKSEAWQKTITLYGEGGKVLSRVKIGGEAGTRRWVDADGKLALVEKATLDDLPWKFADAAEQPTPPPAADGGVQASK